MNSYAYAALRNEYQASARNYVLTVLGKQVAFRLESKGFSRRTEKADTNGAPVSQDDPLFDASLNCLNLGIDGVEKQKPFNASLACEVYGAILVLVADALRTPLEYGRLPDAESFGAYFSQPGHWLASKVKYHTPRMTEEARKLGATYGASADAIKRNADAKIEEYKAWATGVAKEMAATIKLSSKTFQHADTEEIVSFIEEHAPDIGIMLDTELKFAGEALRSSRKAKFERGERTSAMQPGMLKLLTDVGVNFGS
jgi:hypothetical protein